MNFNLFNAMFQQSPIAMVIASIDGKFHYINDSFCQFVGYKKEELINKTFESITYREDIMANKKLIEKLKSGEISFFLMEKRYIHKNQSIVWGLLNVNIIKDEVGVARYFIGQVENITKKKEMEQLFAEKEKMYRIIAENSFDRIMIINLNKEYTFTSPSAQLQLGFQKEEMLGKSIFAFVHPRDQMLVTKAIEAVTSSNITVMVSYRVLHKNGHFSWTETNFKAIFKQGIATEILLVCRDITERKKMETRLMRSNESKNKILESITDAFLSIDKNDRFIYINRAAAKLFNQSVEQLLGAKWKDSFIDNPELLRTYEMVKYQQVDKELDLYIAKTSRWYTVRMYPKNDTVSIYFLDITNQKQLEKKLAESEERFRKLIEHSPDSITVVSSAEIFLYANPAALKLFGLKKVEEMNGHTARDFFPEEYHYLLDDTAKKILDETLKTRIIKHQIIRKDGTIVSVSASLTSISYNGKPAILAIARDISEQIKMEEWLRKTEKLSLVGQLAAGVAHEIRNPMTSIKGFMQLAKSTQQFKESYIDIILSELERTEAIIYEFLALAKPNHIKVMKKANINNIISKVLTLVESQAILYSVSIITNYMGHYSIDCDENQLKQVFINIIQNAIEASKTNGKIYITIKEADSEHLKIIIRDEGCGISEERLKNIGEPFYSTKEKGTGLGLLVSYKIIESHQGNINFTSIQGKGTIVEIILPKQVQINV